MHGYLCFPCLFVSQKVLLWERPKTSSLLLEHTWLIVNMIVLPVLSFVRASSLVLFHPMSYWCSPLHKVSPVTNWSSYMCKCTPLYKQNTLLYTCPFVRVCACVLHFWFLWLFIELSLWWPVLIWRLSSSAMFTRFQSLSFPYLEAIASRLEAIASSLEAIAVRLEAIAVWLEAIAVRLEAIASRLEAIGIRL